MSSNLIKLSTVIFLILFLNTTLEAQNKISLNAGIGYSSLRFNYRADFERPNGIIIETGGIYHLKKMGVGLNLSLYNHSSIDNPDQLELIFNDNIARVSYGNKFFQQTTNLTYFVPTLYFKYDILNYKQIGIRIATGISGIKGNESRTIIRAPGNNEPTTVGYRKQERFDFSWYNSLTVFRKFKNFNLGLKLNNESIVNYWGFQFYFETNL